MEAKFKGVFDAAVHTLVNMKARSVTLFLDDKTTVRVSKPVSRHTKKFFRSTKTEQLILTFGKPNYAARRVMASAKRRKQPLPPMHITYEPAPKKAKKRAR